MYDMGFERSVANVYSDVANIPEREYADGWNAEAVIYYNEVLGR